MKKTTTIWEYKDTIANCVCMWKIDFVVSHLDSAVQEPLQVGNG